MEFGPLRQRILQLAVSGQLVEQLDSEPAVEQVGPAPKPDEVPFEIPAKWKWVQLHSMGRLLTGKTPQTSHPEYFGNEIPFITPGDIDSRCKVNYSNRGLTLTAKQVIKTVPAKTAFMVCIGASFGKCGVAASEIAFNQQINAIVHDERLLESSFLLSVFASPYFQRQMKLKAKATTIPIINKTEWGSLWLPLPPLEEQRRIVAVVDDLMRRLDQIEAAYSEFAGPMSEHFRNLMLDKAIRGELVPQLDSEPEVEQVGPTPKPEEVPFELPPKWKWVQIGALLPFGESNQVTPDQIPPKSWILGLEEIESYGDLLYKQCDLAKVGSNKNSFQAGNVLYSKMRPYLNKVIIADEAGYCSTELLVLDVNQAKAPLIAEYLLYFLRSPYFVEFATKHSHGQKPRLDIKVGRKAWMALPPLEEQRRIVAELEEVFEGVKQLGSLMEYA